MDVPVSRVFAGIFSLKLLHYVKVQCDCAVSVGVATDPVSSCVGFLKHVFRYELIHEQIRRALKSVPHSVVHYEDLVRDPKSALQSILQPLGLDFDPHQLDWAEAEKHEVAGNHMRFDARSELVLDESWRQGLSPLKQRAIEFGTLLSRQTLPKTGAVR